MNRRQFLKSMLVAAGAAAFPGLAISDSLSGVERTGVLEWEHLEMLQCPVSRKYFVRGLVRPANTETIRRYFMADVDLSVFTDSRERQKFVDGLAFQMKGLFPEISDMGEFEQSLLTMKLAI